MCNMVTFLENRLKTVNSGMSVILSFEADRLKDVKGTSIIICNYLDESGYSLSSLTRFFNPENIAVSLIKSCLISFILLTISEL